LIINMEKQINSIKEQILNEIKSGKVKMRPKFYFILKFLLFGLCIIIFFAISLYLFSFIFFILNINGAWLLTGFGLGGIKSLLISLPWFLILIAVILVLLIEFFIASFNFAYRRPLIYSIAIVLLFAIIGGVLVPKTSLHQNLLLSAEKEKLPIFGPFYLNYSRIHFPDTHTGIVSSLSEEVIEIRELDGQMLRIPILGKEILPSNEKIEREDIIIMMGEKIKKFDRNCPCYQNSQHQLKMK